VAQHPRWRLTKPLRARIRAGHPWVYDRALAAPPRTVSTGDIVTIVDDEGPIATAFADPGSPIRARVLGADADLDVDAAWARLRVAAAVELRARDPLLVGCTGRRLVHGEGDRCPGLVIDAYGETAVIVFDGAAAAAFWRPRLPAVLDGLAQGGAEIAHAWLRGERRDRGHGEAVRGDPPAEIVIEEDEARFVVDVRAGQKTGFFLDQRENRRRVASYCADARVLNCFAYTGAFAVYAAAAGAAQVINVDTSADALRLAEQQMVLNDFASARDEYVIGDVFQVLREYREREERFDVIILDPPKFAHSADQVTRATRGYKDINLLALQLLNPNGILATFSCSGLISPDLFQKVVFGASVDANRPAQIIERLTQAPDHPVLLSFPESEYLKGLICRAL
jgi:23S rRNA (cytosine1962-C5)-methyltransferase